MLFQDALTQRIIVVLIVQIWPIFYGSYFAFKLLKRAKTRATFSLSSFFILLSLAYLLAAFSIFFLNTPFAYFFYILGMYFFVFSHCFFVLTPLKSHKRCNLMRSRCRSFICHFKVMAYPRHVLQKTQVCFFIPFSSYFWTHEVGLGHGSIGAAIILIELDGLFKI